MDAEDNDLSGNSAAVLGLLTVAPMTAYAIAEQITRTIGPIWSASRRTLLAEPRRLADRGLAEALPAPDSRAGQRWVATDRGRRAIQRWMTTPVAGTVVHSELLLRMTFADAADRQGLLAMLEDRRSQIIAELAGYLPRLEDYLETGGPFPERLHIVAWIWTFMRRQLVGELEAIDDVRAQLSARASAQPPDLGAARRRLEELHAELLGILERG